MSMIACLQISPMGVMNSWNMRVSLTTEGCLRLGDVVGALARPSIPWRCFVDGNLDTGGDSAVGWSPLEKGFLQLTLAVLETVS